MTTDVVSFGDAGVDVFNISRASSTITIAHNQPISGSPTQTISSSAIGMVTIDGNGGNDTVVLDYSGGDPIPNGLTIDLTGSGAATPTLIVKGVNAGTGHAPVYTLSASSSTLVVSNTSVSDTISYAGVTKFDLFQSTGSASLTVSDGTYRFDSDLGSAATVDVTVHSGATVNFGVSQHLHDVTVSSGGHLNMLKAGGQPLVVHQLTVGGTIDLANNDLIETSPSDPWGVPAAVAAGSIYSSTASADHMALGTVPNPCMDYPITDMDGESIPYSANLVKYTFPGDTNLDGTVDDTDMSVISAHAYDTPGTSEPEWYAGDINYDGVIDGTDSSIAATYYELDSTNFVDLVTQGQRYTSLPLPTLPSGYTRFRTDINWGDGSSESMLGTATGAAHAFSATGLYRATAASVGYSSTAGYGYFRAPVKAVGVSSAAGSPASISQTGSATDTFTLVSNNSGGTLVKKNGTTVASAPTANLISLSITGGATLNIDYTSGNPVPAVGLFADEGTIKLLGPHGTDALVTTSTAVAVGSDVIRHPDTTVVSNQLSTGGTVYAIAGQTLAAFPSTATTTYARAAYVAPGASLVITGSAKLDSLEVAAGGTARMAAHTGTTTNLADIGGLTLDTPAAANGGGVLDLTNNDSILRSTSEGAVQSWLAAGYGYGLWDGQSDGTSSNPAAILSSSAATDPYNTHEIGYLPVGSGSSYWPTSSALDGAAVTAGDSALRYTQYGDINLDGTVDSTDVTLFNSSYGAFNSSYTSSSLTAYWRDGDFNYDGILDDTDKALCLFVGGNQQSRNPGGITVLHITGEGTAVPMPSTGVLARTISATDLATGNPIDLATAKIKLVKTTNGNGPIVPNPFVIKAAAITTSPPANAVITIGIAPATPPGDYTLLFTITNEEGFTTPVTLIITV